MNWRGISTALMGAALMAVSRASAADPRIRLLPYDGDQVVTVDVALGYAAVIELSSDETIDNVVIGNGGVWQITETRSSDRVVVKPLPGAVPTNLVVLTDKRRYVFLLQPAAEGQSSFVVRFNYPADAAGRQTSVNSVATYKLHGDRGLFPTAMYDDGKRTTVSWAKQTPLPAVFTMNGGQEAVVNGRMVGNDYVIEGTASQYKFRFGAAEAVAVRHAARPRK